MVGLVVGNLGQGGFVEAIFESQLAQARRGMYGGGGGGSAAGWLGDHCRLLGHRVAAKVSIRLRLDLPGHPTQGRADGRIVEVISELDAVDIRIELDGSRAVADGQDLGGRSHAGKRGCGGWLGRTSDATGTTTRLIEATVGGIVFGLGLAHLGERNFAFDVDRWRSRGRQGCQLGFLLQREDRVIIRAYRPGTFEDLDRLRNLTLAQQRLTLEGERFRMGELDLERDPHLGENVVVAL